MNLTFLGTGTSYGVPMIGCDCAVCSSNDPKNKRLRPCLLIGHEDKNMLVDTPPDLRTQCLAHGVAHVDAVLYTHEHADHVNGIDDMRRFSALQDGYITCYANSRTAGELHVRFPYCFPDAEARAGEWVRWSLPTLRTETLSGPFNLFGLRVTPMSVLHNELEVTAYRFDDADGHSVVYATDCNYISDETREKILGTNVLILDLLRERPHVSHFGLSEAVEVAREIQAGQTYFVHMSHMLEHHETNAQLPDSMELAYDGLVVDFN